MHGNNFETINGKSSSFTLNVFFVFAINSVTDLYEDKLNNIPKTRSLGVT